MQRHMECVRSYLAIMSVCIASSALADVQFRGLGFVAGGTRSTPRDISANGAVVVGESWVSDHYEAYRWTAETGMVSLDSTESTAFATSADGSMVVGSRRLPGGRDRAVLWPASGGIVDLPVLPGAETRLSRAEGISADGNVIVGSCQEPANLELIPVRWTEVGIERLHNTNRADCHGASVDGSVVIGSRQTGAGWFEAFHWTASSGIVGLGALSGHRTESYGADVSDAGSVVVGSSSYDSIVNHLQAFSWTSDDGMVGLGFLSGNTRSLALSVSGDGLTIVGYSDGGLGGAPFIFTPARGMRPLQAMLESDYGLNLAGWTLGIAWAISADGTAIAGEGINPHGQMETWLVSGLPLRCAADLNNDRAVDLADLATLLSSFGCVSGPCVDLNGDGETALEDLALLLGEFGTACP